MCASGTVAMDGDHLRADLHGADPLIRLRGELRGDAISGVELLTRWLPQRFGRGTEGVA